MAVRVIQTFVSSCGQCQHNSYYSGGVYECRLTDERISQSLRDHAVGDYCPLPFAGPPRVAGSVERRVSASESVLAVISPAEQDIQVPDLFGLVKEILANADTETLESIKNGDYEVFNSVKSALDAIQGENKTLRNALRPFVAVAHDWVDEHGWTDVACQNNRIVDWFGPSDFRQAVSVLKENENAADH